ncbi:MAG: hypothetical protein EP344_14135 [Bacteroidetes bacterium]|nr:MAG: hypothetical protein EP344_14135 [Bacteroidota bacterium]
MQKLAEKSWNLELIISGAAIFLVSYLPALIDKMLWYYLDNLATDGNLRTSMLPVLAYSFFKLIAWVLIATFVVHFILRAFWVGLVGLLAVYPNGIQIDRLPMQTEFSKEAIRRNFSSFPDYIIRIDRLSNQVFSFAFLLALGGLGVSLLYLILFVFIHPAVLPDWMGSHQDRLFILLGLVLVLGLLPGIFQVLAKRPGGLQNPVLRRIAMFVFTYLPMAMLPLVYRPLNYISLIYSSNVPRRRYFISIVAVMVIMIGGVFGVLIQTQMQLRGRNVLVRHEFFGRENTPNTLFPNRYDNLRAADDLLPAVSVESDVVEGPVLKVFVAYRKWLDNHLIRQCSMPAWPDSLGKTQVRALRDSARLACLTGFFRLSVNDSLYAGPDWIFYTHPQHGTYGLLGYLPTGNFSAGKNLLQVQIPSLANADSLQVYGEVPFWFYPSN